MGLLRRLRLALLNRNENFRRFYAEPDLENPVFCSFDVETTGLNPKEDEVLSIGAVKIVDFKVDFSQRFRLLVKPKGELPKESVLIHGIRGSELEEALSPKEALEKFLEFVKGTVLVGYFVQFDVAVLSRYTNEIWGFPLFNPSVDVRDLYRQRIKRRYLAHRESGEKSLDEMAKEFGIEVENRHDAYCDSLLTAFLFLNLIKRGADWRRALN